MTKYLLKRILRSLFSVIMVVAIVMILIYSCLDRTLIFMQDPLFSKVKSNGKEVYMMQQWERYGYLDYIPYDEYMKELVKTGEIDQETYNSSITLGRTRMTLLTPTRLPSLLPSSMKSTTARMAMK